jgi:hypothetical protein
MHRLPSASGVRRVREPAILVRVRAASGVRPRGRAGHTSDPHTPRSPVGRRAEMALKRRTDWVMVSACMALAAIAVVMLVVPILKETGEHLAHMLK